MKKYIPLLLIDLAALAVILYTIWLGNHDSWITSNLSVVGYWHGFSKWLIIWGWITAAVFAVYLIYLAKIFGVNSITMNSFTVLGGILLLVGVYLPYQPEPYPVLSNLHIACSFLAPVCVVGAIVSLLVRLIRRRAPFMGAMLFLMLLLIGIAGVIFVRCTIITTLLEVYVVSGLTVFMTLLALIGLNWEEKDAPGEKMEGKS